MEHARWEDLPPEMRRTIWLASLVPAFLTVPGVLAIVWYEADPSGTNLAAIVAWVSVEIAVVGAFGLRLRRQGAVWRKEQGPQPMIEGRDRLRVALRQGAALLGLLGLELVAIYAVVFGLSPLFASSEAGAIAVNVILLAVIFGLPIAYYLALKALGIADRLSA